MRSYFPVIAPSHSGASHHCSFCTLLQGLLLHRNHLLHSSERCRCLLLAVAIHFPNSTMFTAINTSPAVWVSEQKPDQAPLEDVMPRTELAPQTKGRFVPAILESVERICSGLPPRPKTRATGKRGRRRKLSVASFDSNEELQHKAATKLPSTRAVSKRQKREYGSRRSSTTIRSATPAGTIKSPSTDHPCDTETPPTVVGESQPLAEFREITDANLISMMPAPLGLTTPSKLNAQRSKHVVSVIESSTSESAEELPHSFQSPGTDLEDSPVIARTSNGKHEYPPMHGRMSPEFDMFTDDDAIFDELIASEQKVPISPATETTSVVSNIDQGGRTEVIVIRDTPSSTPQSLQVAGSPAKIPPHCLPPLKVIFRPSLPSPASPNAPIPNLSSTRRVPTCFRIADALRLLGGKYGALSAIELYATVRSSHRHHDVQHLQFADLFFPHHPPYLQGVFKGWRQSELFNVDSTALITEVSSSSLTVHSSRSAEGQELSKCRAIVRPFPRARDVTCSPFKTQNSPVKRARGSLTSSSPVNGTSQPSSDGPPGISSQETAELEILNIWRCNWDDIQYVYGIVEPEKGQGRAASN